MEQTAKYAIESKKNLTSGSSASPLLQRVYHDRCVLIHKVLSTINQSGPVRQLLLLGCGYDTSYFQYGNQVFAVDLPDVIKQARDTSSSVGTNNEGSNRHRYIAHDLRDPEGLLPQLQRAGFDANEETLILLEVVLCYLPEVATTELLRVLGQGIPRSTVVVLDPLIREPEPLLGTTKSAGFTDGFSERLSRSFRERGHAHPRTGLVDASSYRKLFRDQLSWRYSSCSVLADALFSVLSPKERSAAALSTAFDEYSALSLLRQRYIFIITTYSHELAAVLPKLHFEDKTIISSETVDSSAGYKIQSYPNQKNGSSGVIERVDVFTNGPVELLTEISNLIEASFRELQAAHGSIRKYVKNSIKSLQRALNPGTNSKLTDNVTDGNVNSIPKMILFCHRDGVSRQLTGFVVLKIQLLSSTPDSDTSYRGELTNMCVCPSQRRKGLATTLLREVLSASKQWQLTLLELTVLGHMQAARNLYLKTGFHEDSRQSIAGSLESVGWSDGSLELCHLTLRVDDVTI